MVSGLSSADIFAYIFLEPSKWNEKSNTLS
jgi:hypothetical protein